MKIPDVKAAVGKDLKKRETIPALNLEDVKSKKDVALEAQRDKRKVHFATLMDLCHLNIAELETKLQKYKDRGRAPGTHCKRRLWSLRSLHWTRLLCVPDDCRKNNWLYCKMTRLWWISSWCSICAHSGKIRGCSQISRCLDTSSRQICSEIMGNIEDPVITLERNLYGYPVAGLLWERQFEEALFELGWEKMPNWECTFVHRTQGLFLSVFVDDIKMAGKKEKMAPM